MQNVAYKITLGGTTLQSGNKSRLLSLDVQAALNVPSHRCQITVDANVPLTVNAQDRVQVELGYDTTLRRVFTGQASRVAAHLTQVQVEALSSFTALTHAHVNQVYEKQTAQEIVENQLGKLKVKKARVEKGVNFASYTLSASRSVWANLQTLAQQCGFDFYADHEDQACFAAYRPSQIHQFTYGTHILEYQWESFSQPVDGIEVYGESPAGQGQSDDASTWLTKKEVKGRAGQSTGTLLRLVDASARNPNLANEIANNRLTSYKATARGRVCLLGAPEVRLGDAIKLAQMPVAAHNSQLRVIGVRHRISVSRGFTTDVDWEKV